MEDPKVLQLQIRNDALAESLRIALQVWDRHRGQCSPPYAPGQTGLRGQTECFCGLWAARERAGLDKYTAEPWTGPVKKRLNLEPQDDHSNDDLNMPHTY